MFVTGLRPSAFAGPWPGGCKEFKGNVDDEMNVRSAPVRLGSRC